LTTRTDTNYHRWSREEIDLLAEYWPLGGYRMASQYLPGLGPDSVRGKAWALGLRIPGRAPHRRQPTSELIDAAVRRDYRNGRPHLRALARATGRHVGWLKRRAAELGVAAGAKTRNAPWTAEEDAAVAAGIEAGKTLSSVRAAVNRAGDGRSLGAVAKRVCLLGLKWNRSWWTATDVAKMFGVDQSVVSRWIGQNLLAAERAHGPSQTAVTAINPAMNHWKISQKAVVAFMLCHTEQWDHRRMHKEVLLDLLKPGRFGREADAA
jgi:hypothetical protein